VIYDPQQPSESWRIYTNRLAKLNSVSRRRVVRWLRKRGRTKLGLLAVVLAGGLLLGACGEFGADDEEGIGDAPVHQMKDVKVRVFPSPNLFSNIAARCIGPDGVYWTTAEVPLTVVVNDPNCEEGGELYGEP
jgi:hypothetical protein